MTAGARSADSRTCRLTHSRLAATGGKPVQASRLPIFACASCSGWGARPAASQCRLTTRAIEKNALTREADQNCSQLLAIRFTGFRAANSCVKLIYVFKIAPDSCFVPLGSYQWCPVLRNMHALCSKAVLERFRFRYFSGPSCHHQGW